MTNQTLFNIVLLSTLLLNSATASATTPIVTDRPDVAESSETVGKSTAQIESGIDVQITGDRATWALPTKIRIGLTQRTEFHLESDLIALETADTTTINASAFDFGGKVNFGTMLNDKLSLGLLTALTVPLDGQDTWTLSPTLAADWDLGIIGLGTNLGADLTLQGEDDFALRYAVAVGKDITDRWSVYIEQFGRIGFSENSVMEFSTDFGTAFLITPTLQFDLYGRLGLNADAPDGVGVGSGISAKF